jgi:hypothetical protein
MTDQSTTDFEREALIEGARYSVVSHETGKEVCRVWKRDDAEKIAHLLNLSRSPTPAPVSGETEHAWCSACGGTGRMGPYFPGGLSTICGNCTVTPPAPSATEGLREDVDAVEVGQADRDAAFDYLTNEARFLDTALYRRQVQNGEHDDNPLVQTFARHRRALTSSSTATVDEEEEAYELGKRDGYSEAVQDIDLLTGGDGEYRYSTLGGERHCPDPDTMKARIVQRFATLPSSTATSGDVATIDEVALRCWQENQKDSQHPGDFCRAVRKALASPPVPSPDLLEVLKPFAAVADEYDEGEDDTFEVWQDAGPQRLIRASFALRNYRRARDLYQKLAKLENQHG